MKKKTRRGGLDKLAQRRARGLMTARDRIEYLFDPNTFVELQGYVAHHSTNFGLDKKKFLGDGVITGFGKVNDRVVYVYSQDFTVLGGSLGEMHAKKIVNVQDLALKAGAPIIGINDSGGARIQEGINSLAGYGDIFLPQHHLLRGHPPDLGHHGTLRRRRRLFSGHHRLRLHGRQIQLHVRHRPRGHQGGEQGRGHLRGPGRRRKPRHHLRRGPFCRPR